MSAKATTVEVVLAERARHQHGLVTRRQLLAAGLTRPPDPAPPRPWCAALRPPRRVPRRAPRAERRGALPRRRPRVRRRGAVERASGGAPVRATQGLGPAAAGHRAAQETPRGRPRCGAGAIDRPDRAVHRGIPATAVPRTLVDLAADLPLDALARACHEAGVRYKTTPAQVAAVLARRPQSPRRGEASAGSSSGDAPRHPQRARAEVPRAHREHGLPLPQTNRPAGGHRVDCRWPERRLTVELDSYRFHHSRHAWEQDRRREREARARGDDFRRYTWADVFEEPRQTSPSSAPSSPSPRQHDRRCHPREAEDRAQRC